MLEPFHAPDATEALADLRARLRATRWPATLPDVPWALGTDPAYLRGLVEHWADGFDWDAQQAALDRLPRFRATVGGRSLHVIHARSASEDALPLVLCHGWPDCHWRYSKVVDLLVDPGAHGGDPADAFHVVVPDMPGYGFSDAPTDAALDSRGVAGLWAELLEELGYDRFGAAGGDIGSGVARFLALDHPERVVGVHRMDGGLPAYAGDPAELEPEERAWMDRIATWSAREGAYAAMHRTRPQTLSFGLTDSPVGLAAWIVEKLRAWSDCDGDLERSYTPDEVLTLVTTYWLTGTIGSSTHMYAANAAIPLEQHQRRVEVPSGFSLFPADILTPPRAWLERTTDLVRLTHPPRGGHFAPFEEPELYAQELRDLFRPLR